MQNIMSTYLAFTLYNYLSPQKSRPQVNSNPDAINLALHTPEPSLQGTLTLYVSEAYAVPLEHFSTY
jgi:hypothetical protein